MSVQKKKHTHASKGRRRSHHHLKKELLVICKYCGEKKRPHHICNNCHKY